MSARRRRRAGANERVTIFWRDIPAQVTTTVAGDKGSWLLDQRFQLAIDAAATVAGLTDADDYVLEWRRVAEPFDGDAADAETDARAHAEKLHGRYPPGRVRALVANGGLETTPTPADTGSDQPSAEGAERQRTPDCEKGSP